MEDITSSRRHGYQDRIVITTMCVRKDLPCTLKARPGVQMERSMADVGFCEC